MVAKTRQSDKVAGRACELYLLQDQDDKSPGEICVAKGIGNALHYGFLAGNIPDQKGYPAWLPSSQDRSIPSVVSPAKSYN